MNAVMEIKEMLKEIHEAGDVNAMQIWKGWDNEGNYGWCYQMFGRSEITCMGRSLTEVRQWIDEGKELQEDIDSQFPPANYDVSDGEWYGR
jgi:hypothetical protein